MVIVGQRMLVILNSFPFLALPFFVIAGLLMEKGGITKRLIDFATLFVARITGGLGQVVVGANLAMSGASGSATADCAATGTVLIPALARAGYSPAFAAALTAAASTLGAIIPPSVLFVIYGAMTGTSIGRLFLGGVVPGLIMALYLFIATYVISKRRGYPKLPAVSWREAWDITLKALPGLAHAGDRARRDRRRRLHPDRSRRHRGRICVRARGLRLSRSQMARDHPDDGKGSDADRRRHADRFGERAVRLDPGARARDRLADSRFRGLHQSAVALSCKRQYCASDFRHLLRAGAAANPDDTGADAAARSVRGRPGAFRRDDHTQHDARPAHAAGRPQHVHRLQHCADHDLGIHQGGLAIPACAYALPCSS